MHDTRISWSLVKSQPWECGTYLGEADIDGALAIIAEVPLHAYTNDRCRPKRITITIRGSSRTYRTDSLKRAMTLAESTLNQVSA